MFHPVSLARVIQGSWRNRFDSTPAGLGRCIYAAFFPQTGPEIFLNPKGFSDRSSDNCFVRKICVCLDEAMGLLSN
jgi:hypothetical protein